MVRRKMPVRKTRSRTRTAKAGSPGPKIVRAWFDTVINPLLKSLDHERSCLSRFNWTWQFRTGSLDSIRPVQDYVLSEAKENLEQFLDFYPRIRQKTKHHDDAVASLE